MPFHIWEVSEHCNEILEHHNWHFCGHCVDGIDEHLVGRISILPSLMKHHSHDVVGGEVG